VQAPAHDRLIKGGIPTANLVRRFVVANTPGTNHSTGARPDLFGFRAYTVDRSTLAGIGLAPPQPNQSGYLRNEEIVLASAKVVVD